jgi:uncharacterized delta-60 repeat protein
MHWERNQRGHSSRSDVLTSTNLRFIRLGWIRCTLLFVVVTASLVLLGVLLKALAAEGNLDPSFGGGSGTATTDFGGSDDQARAMAVQPDGRIVVVGQTNPDGEPNHTRTALARYTRDGLPDSSFGQGGIVIASTASSNIAYAVAVQTDGKILTAGIGLADLTRYNSDGSLDTSFGTGGNTGTAIRAYALALQPNGKILVGGYLPVSYQNTDFAVARYNSDGTLDTSFGSGGKVTTEFLGGHDYIHALALQPDGKIVAAGQLDCCSSKWYFALARYNGNGTIDTSFGNNGRAWTDLSPGFGFPYHRSNAVAIQPDGKILAAGGSKHYNDTDSFAVVRYNSNGTVDSIFGSGGQVTTKFNGNSSTAYAIALRPDGRFYVAGTSGSSFALERFKPDGSLDTSFGSNHSGQITTQILNTSAASALALQPDGKVLLAGTDYSSTNDFALARYQAERGRAAAFDYQGDGRADASIFCPSDGSWLISDGSGSVSSRQWGLGSDKPLAGDFDGDGRADIAVFRASEGNWYIIRSSDGAVILRNWGGNDDIPAPGDYDGDSKSDLAVFRPSDGNWYILNSATNTATLRGWGASGDKPVPADYDGDGKTDMAVYRPSDGNWYIINSRDGAASVTNWGDSMDKPVEADYDGDGRADIAVYRPLEGNWYIRSSTGAIIVKGWGAGNDLPVPGDYDGDGKADVAVFRPLEGTWYIIQTSTNSVRTTYLGGSEDIPVPAAYLPQ